MNTETEYRRFLIVYFACLIVISATHGVPTLQCPSPSAACRGPLFLMLLELPWDWSPDLLISGLRLSVLTSGGLLYRLPLLLVYWSTDLLVMLVLVQYSLYMTSLMPHQLGCQVLENVGQETVQSCMVMYCLYSFCVLSCICCMVMYCLYSFCVLSYLCSSWSCNASMLGWTLTLFSWLNSVVALILGTL